MRFQGKWIAGLALGLLGLVLAAAPAAGEDGKEGCTVIGVGRLASIDGSVITSHTDCCSECRIQIIPGRVYPKGTLAPVHWGMTYFGNDDERRALPLGDSPDRKDIHLFPYRLFPDERAPAGHRREHVLAKAGA
jgi:hypothetical protein